MRARQTVLATTDVQQAIPEVRLVRAERKQCGDAQAMAIGEWEHGGIPVSMASQAFRRANERVPLGGGEVFSAPPIGIGPLARWPDAVWGRAWNGRRSPSRGACSAWARCEGRAGHRMLQKAFPEKRRGIGSSRIESVLMSIRPRRQGFPKRGLNRTLEQHRLCSDLGPILVSQGCLWDTWHS